MKRRISWILLGMALLGARPGEQEAGRIEEQLQAQMVSANEEFHRAYQRVVGKVSDRFGIDYPSLERLYGDLYRECAQKRAILERTPKSGSERRQLKLLQEKFQDPQGQRYLEARLFLENELSKDSSWKARYLALCEEILESLLEADALFYHFFRSKEFERRHGLLMVRLAWGLPYGVFGSTNYLDAYTLFADRSRMPALITLSPWTFQSLPYLRSLLVHELNHVLLDRLPVGKELGRLPARSGKAKPLPSPFPYGQWLVHRWGSSPEYAGHLVHEYSCFTAQLLYDDRLPVNSTYRVSPESRRSIERLRDWVYLELDSAHQVFLAKHPDPPIAAYIDAWMREEPFP